MKSTTKRIISIPVLIIILFFFVLYIKNHISDFKQLTIVNPIYLLPLFILIFIPSINNGLVIKYLLEPFNIKMNFKEWFGLSVVTSFYNMITPFRGGAVSRAVYLKNRYDFSYTNFLATLSGIYVINFLIASFLGLLSLVYLYYTKDVFSPIVTFILLFFFIPLLIIILFSPRFSETKSAFLNKLIRVLNGWNLIRKNRKVVLLVSLIYIFQITLSSIAGILSYSVFGISISFIDALFLASIGSLTILVAITPSGLGINEAVAVFSALVIGITPAQSLSVAIIGRVIGMSIIFILGPIFSYVLMKNLKKEKRI